MCPCIALQMRILSDLYWLFKIQRVSGYPCSHTLVLYRFFHLRNYLAFPCKTQLPYLYRSTGRWLLQHNQSPTAFNNFISAQSDGILITLPQLLYLFLFIIVSLIPILQTPLPCYSGNCHIILSYYIHNVLLQYGACKTFT